MGKTGKSELTENKYQTGRNMQREAADNAYVAKETLGCFLYVARKKCYTYTNATSVHKCHTGHVHKKFLEHTST